MNISFYINFYIKKLILSNPKPNVWISVLFLIGVYPRWQVTFNHSYCFAFLVALLLTSPVTSLYLLLYVIVQKNFILLLAMSITGSNFVGWKIEMGSTPSLCRVLSLHGTTWKGESKWQVFWSSCRRIILQFVTLLEAKTIQSLLAWMFVLILTRIFCSKVRNNC